MESQLRHIRLSIAARYARDAGCALSTVSRRCRNDSAFFDRISDRSKSFTVKTFDEVLAWFNANWPEGKAKPGALRDAFLNDEAGK